MTTKCSWVKNYQLQVGNCYSNFRLKEIQEIKMILIQNQNILPSSGTDVTVGTEDGGFLKAKFRNFKNKT